MPLGWSEKWAKREHLAPTGITLPFKNALRPKGQLMKHMTTRQKISAVTPSILECRTVRPHGRNRHCLSQQCVALLLESTKARRNQHCLSICTVPKVSGTCTQRDTQTISWKVPEGTEFGLVFEGSLVTNRRNCVPSSNDDVTESKMTREIQDYDNLASKWNQ